MEILYTNTIDDQIDSDRINRKINYFYKFYERIILCCILPIIELIIALKAIIDGYYFAALFLILVAICIVPFFYFKYPYLIDKFRTKRILSDIKLNKIVSLPKKITVDEKLLTVCIEKKQASVKLERIANIIDYNDKIFIISKWRYVLLTIPNKSFSSLEERNLFMGMVTSKVKN